MTLLYITILLNYIKLQLNYTEDTIYNKNYYKLVNLL